MHNVFVRKPGYAFHGYECGYYNEHINEYCLHNLIFFQERLRGNPSFLPVFFASKVNGLIFWQGQKVIVQ